MLFSHYSVGARLATDLVNTAPEVRRSTGEGLADPADLQRFLSEHEVDAAGRPTEADLAETYHLRRQVRTILESPTGDAVADGANALLARGATIPVLARDADDRWQWHLTTSTDLSHADQIAAIIGHGLLGALRALGHDRFRHCASPICDGMFVDTSRAGRRRYCMPELCGNRLNVASHRARRRSAG